MVDLIWNQHLRSILDSYRWPKIDKFKIDDALLFIVQLYKNIFKSEVTIDISSIGYLLQELAYFLNYEGNVFMAVISCD